MHKFVVIYRRVDDEAVLEAFFSGTHLPLLERLPGLIGHEVSRIIGQPAGQSRFHLMVEAYFQSPSALHNALISTPGIALMNALRPWAEERLITWFYADAFREEAAPPGT